MAADYPYRVGVPVKVGIRIPSTLYTKTIIMILDYLFLILSFKCSFHINTSTKPTKQVAVSV